MKEQKEIIAANQIIIEGKDASFDSMQKILTKIKQCLDGYKVPDEDKTVLSRVRVLAQLWRNRTQDQDAAIELARADLAKWKPLGAIDLLQLH